LVDAKAQLAEIAMHDNEDDEAIVAENFATLVELAATGSARAQFLLAETCLLGRPWPRDFECARRNFVLTDAGGFAPGAPNLGLFAQAGIAGPVDLDAAETWFRKAVAQGASASRYELGRLLLKRGKNIQEAIDLLLPSAEEGNPGSAYVLLRYCREHPDCDVAPDKIAALKKQIAELTPRLKNVLAWGLGCDVMSDAEDGRYAVKLIESMPSQEKDKWAVQDTLAAAYARTGDFENAVSAQRRSIDTMPDTETRVQRLILQERLSLYQSGKTWDLPY
jgi:tetratricopeptide (TPR) repeat protein